MNFSLDMFGANFEIYNRSIKLFHQSATESDYGVEFTAHKRLSPCSPIHNSIKLVGSTKKEFIKIIVDFDDLLASDVENAIIISPSLIEEPITQDGMHYWAIFGCLVKVMGDVSPAYVTGFLLENNMKKELETFMAYSTQLPFAVKVAVTELITDAQ